MYVSHNRVSILLGTLLGSLTSFLGTLLAIPLLPFGYTVGKIDFLLGKLLVRLIPYLFGTLLVRLASYKAQCLSA